MDILSDGFSHKRYLSLLKSLGLQPLFEVGGYGVVLATHRVHDIDCRYSRPAMHVVRFRIRGASFFDVLFGGFPH